MSFLKFLTNKYGCNKPILSNEIEYEEEYNLGILSDFEKQIFLLFGKGMKVKEISKAMNVNSKSVYNCVYRIKNKMLIK